MCAEAEQATQVVTGIVASEPLGKPVLMSAKSEEIADMSSGCMLSLSEEISSLSMSLKKSTAPVTAASAAFRGFSGIKNAI